LPLIEVKYDIDLFSLEILALDLDMFKR